MSEEEFDTIYQRCTSEGWLSYKEARLLVNTAEQTTGPMVEVGSYMGRSAMLLGQLVDETNKPRTLYCIDPWEDGFIDKLTGDEVYGVFCTKIKTLEHHRIISVRLKIEDWNPISVEFIYLDGDHTYKGTKSQIQKALQCKPKVICVHDVNDKGGGLSVRTACIDLLGMYDKRVERLAIWNSLI